VLENVARRDSSYAYSRAGPGPAVIDQSSTSKSASRGREQHMMEYFRKQGVAANEINGVSPLHPRRAAYMRAADEAFGPMP
jgi:hypothetical protein